MDGIVWLRRILPLVLIVGSTPPLSADVKIQEKSLVTFAGLLGRAAGMLSGPAARDGIISTVALKQGRRARFNELAGEIVDLAAERIYVLDMKRKSYSVTTFDEVRRRFKDAQANMESDAGKTEPDDLAKQMEVDFQVENTAQTKTINGFAARRVIATVTVREKGKTLEEGGGLILTSDMWLTPAIESLKEISDFERRYWAQIAGSTAGNTAQMAATMTIYPFLKDAMIRLEEEKQKADGTVVVTTLTVESVKSQAQMSEPSDDPGSAATRIGELLGGLGAGRGSDQKQEARTTFMKSTHEVLNVSTDVTAAEVSIPAGFIEK